MLLEALVARAGALMDQGITSDNFPLSELIPAPKPRPTQLLKKVACAVGNFADPTATAHLCVCHLVRLSPPWRLAMKIAYLGSIRPARDRVRPGTSRQPTPH